MSYRSSARYPTGLARLAAKTLSATAAAVLIVAATAAGASAAEKVRWKVPIAFGSNLPALGDNILYISDMVKKASGGTVQFKVFEPGKLVPPFQITEAVGTKKLPAGYTWLGYDQGRIPAAALIAAVPFGMEPWEFNAWWYEGGGQALGEAMYAEHGVHVLLCGIIGPETAGWFRGEIKSLDDVKGLKIRFAGLGGRVMQELGASVTLLPGGEIFQALEKGAIDATEFSMPAIDQKLGFHKIIKNNYFPGWHQTFTALHFMVNKKLWDGLGEQNQALIELACTAGVTRNLSRGEAIQGGIIAGFPDQGVTAHTLPEPLLRELQTVTEKVLEEEASKDEHFRKIYDSQRAFQAEYKLWKSLGYLPRDF